MIMHSTWISTIALGAMMLLMPLSAAAEDTRPDQRDQPAGSVRHAKKKVTRPPAVTSSDAVTRQRAAQGSVLPSAARGDRDHERGPAHDNDHHGDDASRNAARSGARDGHGSERADLHEGDEHNGRADRDEHGERDGHNRNWHGDWDGHADHDGRGPGDRHEYPGIRRPYGGYREFHRGPDAVRLYGKRPLCGSAFLRPPEHCDVVHFGGCRYFVHDDIYYVERPVLGEVRYVVVPPPVGVHVSYLPATAVAVQIGGFSFYYCDDTYYTVEYVSDAPQYVVAEVPLGASIAQLPEGYEPVAVSDVTYYRVGAVYYRPYFQQGRVVYVHVNDPW